MDRVPRLQAVPATQGQVAHCMPGPAVRRLQGPGGQCMQDLAVPCTQGPAAHYMQAQVVRETQDRVELPTRGQVGLVMRVLAGLAMPRMRQANSAPQFANP